MSQKKSRFIITKSGKRPADCVEGKSFAGEFDQLMIVSQPLFVESSWRPGLRLPCAAVFGRRDGLEVAAGRVSVEAVTRADMRRLRHGRGILDGAGGGARGGLEQRRVASVKRGLTAGHSRGLCLGIDEAET